MELTTEQQKIDYYYGYVLRLADELGEFHAMEKWASLHHSLEEWQDMAHQLKQDLETE